MIIFLRLGPVFLVKLHFFGWTDVSVAAIVDVASLALPVAITKIGLVQIAAVTDAVGVIVCHLSLQFATFEFLVGFLLVPIP